MKKIRTSLSQFIQFFRTFFLVWLWQTVTFSGLLLCYLSYKFVRFFLHTRITPTVVTQFLEPKATWAYKKVVAFSTQQERTINRVSLIDLAIKNMLFKRSRALITVGGMAIGVGAIVFLVSLGFGLQEMVIARVARLDELRQADVSVQPGSKDALSDETLGKIKELTAVEQVLPLIAIVSRVEYQSSVSDMAVYGVTSDYLNQSAIRPSAGELFDSNELASGAPAGRVAGVQTSVAESYTDGEYELTPDVELPIEFGITEGEWVKVRSKATRSGELLGYTRRSIGTQQGLRIWGESYPESQEMTLVDGEKSYGPWVKADFALWFQQPCEKDSIGCIDGAYIEAKNESGEQSVVTGYTAVTNVMLKTVLAPSDPVGQVLGITTETDDTEDDGGIRIAQAATTDAESSDDDSAISDEQSDTTESTEGWVEIASESAAATTQQVTTVSLGQGAKKVAVVNRAMLQVLGLPESEAVGKTFKTTFIVVGDLLDKPGEKVESSQEDYTIVGVVPEDKTPFFYVPFVDLRLMGINQYSQMKLVVSQPSDLAQARKQVEALGFATRSVADTVKQIDRLFATARVLLAVLGFVALSIAALGMFNTLTVSLLERTREVGLMKAMGMRSNEVRELFLTESLVMGFFGGVLGILFGILAGESLGLLLTIFSAGKGVGYIDIAYLPASFILFVFVLSLFVGVFTGIYPARRATTISALDALRYE